MKKKIWLTSVESSQESVQQIMGTLTKYGLGVDGHFWEDDLEKMAWCKPRREIVDTAVSMWLIHGSAESLAKESIRYGLSLLALTVQAARGLGFPIVFLQEGDAAIVPESLPTPLAGGRVLEVSSGYGPKIIADLHKPVPSVRADYRIDVYGIPQVGQWFEVGPRDSGWDGAIFGTAPEGITFQAVGAAGQLPEKSTLNYPQQGIKLNIGDREFDAWGVQNEFDGDTSYYLKVDSYPEAVMFCPYAQDDEAEAYVISLK